MKDCLPRRCLNKRCLGTLDSCTSTEGKGGALGSQEVGGGKRLASLTYTSKIVDYRRATSLLVRCKAGDGDDFSLFYELTNSASRLFLSYCGWDCYRFLTGEPQPLVTQVDFFSDVSKAVVLK